MLVKPAPGMLVRDPRTKLRIPADGIDAPDHDVDFARLLADGDLEAPIPAFSGSRPDNAAPGEQISGETADGDHQPPAADADATEEPA